MIEILLLIIACCLLFGSEKTKQGIKVIMQIIAVGIVAIIVIPFLISLGGSGNEVEDYESDYEQIVEDDYIEFSVEELNDILSGDYTNAKMSYDGMKVSVTGKFDLPYEEYGIQVEEIPYITSLEPNAEGETLWIPCMADNDEVQEQFGSIEQGSVVTFKGYLWVANYEDFGIAEEGDDLSVFAIVLIVEAIE